MAERRAVPFVAAALAAMMAGSIAASLVPAPRPTPSSWTPASAAEQDCQDWGRQRASEPGPAWRDPVMVCPLMAPDGRHASRVVIDGDLGDAPARVESGRVGLTFMAGRCGDHPDLPCIDVRRGDGGDHEWLGLTTNITPSHRSVVLADDSDVVTCHELLHAVGVAHHWQRDGCLSSVREDAEPSAAELAVLRDTYAVAHE